MIKAKTFISQPKFEVINKLEQDNADRKRRDNKLNVRHHATLSTAFKISALCPVTASFFVPMTAR